MTYNPEHDADEVQSAEQVYSDMLDALVESCKKNRVLLTQEQVHAIMEQVSDAVVQQTRSERDRLNETLSDYFSRSGIEQGKMEEAAYREILGQFGPKPRPVPTNPATYAAKGEEL